MIYKLRPIFYCFLLGSLSIVGCKNSSNTIDSKCLFSIKNFFNRAGTSDFTISLDSLLLSNKNINFTDSATTKLRDGFKNVNELSGKYLGYKLLKKRVVEDDIAIYSCLVKYEKKFYRFVFIFYKTGANVNIFKFAYDDVLDLELEESLKMYIQ